MNIRSELLGRKTAETARLVTRSDDGNEAISLREMSRADGACYSQPGVDRICMPRFSWLTEQE